MKIVAIGADDVLKRANTTQVTCAVFFRFKCSFTVGLKAIKLNYCLLTVKLDMQQPYLSTITRLLEKFRWQNSQGPKCVNICDLWRELRNILDMNNRFNKTVLLMKRLLEAFRWQNLQENQITLSVYAVFDNVLQKYGRSGFIAKNQGLLIHEFFLHPSACFAFKHSHFRWKLPTL